VTVRDKYPIVGPAVIAQDRLRPRAPVRDFDEFLDFLRRMRDLFGPVDRPRRPTVGKHFKL
jgi:hypothetical protein